MPGSQRLHLCAPDAMVKMGLQDLLLSQNHRVPVFTEKSKTTLKINNTHSREKDLEKFNSWVGEVRLGMGVRTP